MSFSLPPGCRFFPSEEQLLSYYLTNKNGKPRSDGKFNGYDLMRELDLYHYEPFELPDAACFSYGYGARKRHWYCYTVRVVKEGRGRRRTRSGYWKRRGRVRDVAGPGGKVAVGSRTTFVFYLENSSDNAVRTDWVMYEYALGDQLKDSFVLCRVFLKPRGGNSTSENGLSSCAEESVSAVRHVGIQHDGCLTPDTIEVKVHDVNFVDRRLDISKYPMRLVTEVDDQVMTGPVSVANFQFPLGMQPSEQVGSSGLLGSSLMLVEGLTAQQLLSIQEEDFIELDDLLH